MTSSRDDGTTVQLSLAVLERIDEVRARFEERWKAGPAPDLGEFLEGTGPVRAALFRALLGVDVRYRHRAGERPDPDDYLRRFPAESAGAGLDDLLGGPGSAADAAGPAPGGGAPPKLPRGLSRYRIERVLRQGAFGTVYLAEDRQLRRPVALKVSHDARRVRGGSDDAFLAEARALAGLDHPGLVPVYDVGRVDGRSYIVSKLIEGSNLAERLRQGPPARRQAAQWALTVARALQAAHESGLIHRDVKPSNVLVAGNGAAYLGDFGLALRGADADDGHRLLGTPAYMSPEQARGEGHLADARTDVFSLGAVLYEMLTGRPPFQAESVNRTLFQVLEYDPVPPLRLNPAVGPDLDTICMKCLEKAPERRYPTAAALADDLQRYLDNRPIRARPTGPAGVAVRWARRNPTAAAALAGTLATFLAAFALVTWSYVRAERAFRDETRQRREVQLRERAERWERYRAALMSASNALAIENATAARDSLDAAPPEYRNWEWRHLLRRLDTADRAADRPGATTVRFSPRARRAVFLDDLRPPSRLDLFARPARADLGIDSGTPGAVLSPDGTALAFTRAGTLVVWDLPDDRPRFTVPVPGAGGGFLRFDPESRRLAFAPGDKTLRVVDAADGSERLTVRGESGPIGRADFSPDGRTVAVVEGERTVRLRDAADGRVRRTLPPSADATRDVLYSPRGDRLVCAEAFPGNRLRLWDPRDGAPVGVLEGHSNEMFSWAFSPDGARLATGSYDQTVRLWDARTARGLATLTGHKGWVTGVSFSPDGRVLATASLDGTCRLWDGSTGAPLAVLHGEASGPAQAWFTPDGSTLLASSGGSVRVYDAGRVERGGVLRGHGSFVYDVAFHPDGRRLASAAWDGTARLWDATTGATVAVLRHAAPGVVSAVAFRPDGRVLASFGRDGLVRLWDPDTGRPLGTVAVPGGQEADSRLKFSPRGDLLACGSNDRTVHVWRVEVPQSGPAVATEVAALAGHQGWLNDVAFGPDGAWVATADSAAGSPVRVWDLTGKSPVRLLHGHSEGAFSLAVTRDGRRLASGSADGTVRLWDTSDWSPAGVLNEGSQVYGVAFTPDGTRLVTGCSNNTIRLWDVARRQPVCALHGHEAYVHQVAFSPDGTRLASASGDATVRVWDSLSAPERASREPRPRREKPPTNLARTAGE